MSDLIAAFHDLPTLLRLRDLVAAADPEGPPALQLVYDEAEPRPPVRVGFLAGSFNPLHLAHEALARAALTTGHLDRVVLVLSKRTVDKEQVSGLTLEDRLFLLQLFAARRPGHAVALVNRGLYAEQAAILHGAWPDAELSAIVGFDKIVQIFDPRYYADRDAALEQLFGLASALVAPRAGADLADLTRLLDRPENRRFRDRVRPLPIAPEYAALSSSELRAEAGTGEMGSSEVPDLVSAFVVATGAYAPPVRLPDGEEVSSYALRTALLDALSRARPWAESRADFPRLLRLAVAPSPEGRAFRAWLGRPPAATAPGLAAFQGMAR